MNDRVLVTGASGFVGRALIPFLRSKNGVVRGAVRNKPEAGAQDVVEIGDIDGQTDWSRALKGMDVVVHLAARVHVMSHSAIEPFRRVNVEGSRRLAEKAVAQGVRRLIFVSSIKVNGERTIPGKPFVPSDAPAPEDPYAVSKLEAELLLRELAEREGLELTVIRPTLVYGPQVKGNLLRLARAIRRGIPLPFSSVRNQRSLLGLDNLVHLLSHCVSHPAAPGRTFLASDGSDLSTPELILEMAHAMGTSPRLFPVPAEWLHAAGQLLGRGDEIKRLTGTLQVDIEETRSVLGWTPPFSTAEGLRRMVNPV